MKHLLGIFFLVLATSAPALGQTCEGRVGNFVWHDLNGDGLQDAGEPGIGDVRMVLKDGSGGFLDETTTGPAGAYQFTDMCAGDYIVEVDESTLPAGFQPSLCNVGPDDTIDNDCSPNAFTFPTDDHRARKVDFGYVGPCTGRIGDFVWHDESCDGIQDPGEPGIGGVTLHLRNAMGDLIATTTTGGDGLYVFENLCAGMYTVEVDPSTLPPSFVPAPCNVGMDDAVDNDCSPAFVILPTDDAEDLTIDFGYKDDMSLSCRLTAGPRRNRGISGNTWSCGGQIGAPTAAQPQPCGEWTHSQISGPAGKFTFHAGTASALPDTEIDLVICSDPGNCNPAFNPAFVKQMDFCGVGSFRNVRSGPLLENPNVLPHESLHWFSAHVEDLGEPAAATPGPECPEQGFEGTTALCSCPDFYRIRIHETSSPASPVIYEIFDYLGAGNFQMHTPTGSTNCIGGRLR